MRSAASDKVTWFQLPADDVDRAWAFYHQVFGWSQEAAYLNVPQLGAINGEIAPRSAELQHPRVVIRVDDVDEALQRIKDAGGQVLVQRAEIPEIKMVFAVFIDTEGNAVNVVGDLL